MAGEAWLRKERGQKLKLTVGLKEEVAATKKFWGGCIQAKTSVSGKKNDPRAGRNCG